jgi:hypothetical protein
MRIDTTIYNLFLNPVVYTAIHQPNWNNNGVKKPVAFPTLSMLYPYLIYA